MDSQVLPALKSNAGANNPPEYAPGEEYNEEESKNGEPISAENRANAQPLIHVFGEPVIRMIFSRTWGLREKGIDEIEDQVLNRNMFDEGESFVASVNLVRNTIQDKIVGVNTRSMQFFTNLCQRIANPSISSQQQREVKSYESAILGSLVEKLGDNLAKSRQASENALLAMCNNTAFGVGPVIDQITRKVSAQAGQAKGVAAKKAMNSNKLIIGKY